MDVGQQHKADVLLFDFVEFEELRKNVFPVERRRQQAVFMAASSGGICPQKEIKSSAFFLPSAER